MWKSNKPSFNPTDFPSDGTCARACVVMPREDAPKLSFIFYRVHLRGNKPTIYLDDENGLHKYVTSTVTDVYPKGKQPRSPLARIVREEIPDATIIEFEEEPKVLLLGDYYDYRYALKYALERFPKISKEIYRDKEKPEEWKENQQKIIGSFYRMFCNSLMNSDLSTGRVKSLIKKICPFNANKS